MCTSDHARLSRVYLDTVASKDMKLDVMQNSYVLVNIYAYVYVNVHVYTYI